MSNPLNRKHGPKPVHKEDSMSMFIMNPDTGNVELELVQRVLDDYASLTRVDRSVRFHMRRALVTAGYAKGEPNGAAIVRKLAELPADSFGSLLSIIKHERFEDIFAYVEVLAKLEVHGAAELEELFNAASAGDDLLNEILK